MEKIIATEKKVKDYYENIWSPSVHLEGRDENPFLGFHYGYYEKGITTWKEAAINMNDFIGRLIKLDNNKTIEILDAGCGTGATSVHLAIKYPNVNFTGITLAPAEVEFAKKIQKERRVENTKFLVGSYTNTGFPKGYFDAVFALESFCYAQIKKDFVLEMKRVLKPGGKLVVLDGFRTDRALASFMQKVYNSFLSRRAVPNLMSLTDFKLYLEKEGFKEITILDLTKSNGIVYNFLQADFLKFLHNFLSLQFKRIIKGKAYKPEENADYILGALVLELLLGIGKKIGYYAITAVKE